MQLHVDRWLFDKFKTVFLDCCHTDTEALVEKLRGSRKRKMHGHRQNIQEDSTLDSVVDSSIFEMKLAFANDDQNTLGIVERQNISYPAPGSSHVGAPADSQSLLYRTGHHFIVIVSFCIFLVIIVVQLPALCT